MDSPICLRHQKAMKWTLKPKITLGFLLAIDSCKFHGLGFNLKHAFAAEAVTHMASFGLIKTAPREGAVFDSSWGQRPHNPPPPDKKKKKHAFNQRQ